MSSAADEFLSALTKNGVKCFFCNPGTDFPPIVEAFYNAQAHDMAVPEPIVVPHENLAVTMAHGYFLATGEAQAVMVHVSVGTANTINAIADASRDEVPILLCAGRNPITEVGRLGSRNRPIHWAQEMFDQAGMLREWVKWDYELRDPGQTANVVDRAFEVMSLLPSRPVYLTLPREVLAAPAEPVAMVTTRQTKVSMGGPNQADIDTVGQWIAQSPQVVLVCGGLGRSTDEVLALDRVAETFCLPVVPFNSRYMSLRTTHPMHCGFDPSRLISTADTIIVLESDVPWIPNHVKPRPDAKIVCVGQDPSYSRYPMRTVPKDLAFVCGAADFLVALEIALKKHSFTTEFQALARDRLTECERLRQQVFGSVPTQAPSLPLDPNVLSHMIGLKFQDAILVDEYPLRTSYCQRTEPQSLFRLGPAGGLGWSFGAALGIKKALPERDVVAIMGDGAYMFANPSAGHWTADVHGLPIIVVVFNNSRYGAVRNSTLSMYANARSGKDKGMLLSGLESHAQWSKVAEAHGGRGRRVECYSELESAFEWALKVLREEKTQVLLDVVCDY